MSEFKPQRRDSFVHNKQSVQPATTLKLELDFSDLLPTPEQIASYNRYSTGNTPSRSDMREEQQQDEYSPPSSVTGLPTTSHDQPSADGALFLPNPTNMEAFVDACTNASRGHPLTWQLFESWSEVLSDWNRSREELEAGLLYAVSEIMVLEKESVLCAFDYVESATGFFVTGMPLEMLSWADVDVDRMRRMSTMAVKSGLLQALARIHELDGLGVDGAGSGELDP